METHKVVVVVARIVIAQARIRLVMDRQAIVHTTTQRLNKPLLTRPSHTRRVAAVQVGIQPILHDLF